MLRDARQRYATGALEQRRVAIGELEEASRLTPADPELLQSLGRAYLDAGFNHSAQLTFERLTRVAPEDADGWFGLGLLWKRDWLATLDSTSRVRAIGNLSDAVRLRPAFCDAWIGLSVLRLEEGDADGAATAAARAVAAEPERAEARLAIACLAYRSGRAAFADSMFTEAIPRLPPGLAARFADLTPLVTPDAGEAIAKLTARERSEYARRFWTENDPDPTTPRSEARLEYWSRVAHATLLFTDTWNPVWDARGELYVRYGAPARIEYQPPGVSLAQRPNKFDRLFLTGNGPRRIGDADPMWYPLHAQVWDYPELGLRVLLEDLAISQHYELPRRDGMDTDPSPGPEAIANPGLLATAGGRAVFPTQPAGVRALPVLARVSRFESDKGPRLLAQLETPGTPDDSLAADCVVLNAAGHVVARSSRVLSPSACDPAALRAGEFGFDLPPGSYRLTVAVDDGRGGRRVLRTVRDVTPAPAALTMSDLVLVCGALDVAAGANEVRLNPNLPARITGDQPLRAYFEVYHLRPDAAGRSQFEYEYTVRSTDKDPRPWYRRLWSGGGHGARVAARSEQEGAGSLRRQYVSVPAASLPPGHYHLAISVRDRIAGTRTEQGTEFTKAGVTVAPAGVDAR